MVWRIHENNVGALHIRNKIVHCNGGVMKPRLAAIVNDNGAWGRLFNPFPELGAVPVAFDVGALVIAGRETAIPAKPVAALGIFGCTTTKKHEAEMLRHLRVLSGHGKGFLEFSLVLHFGKRCFYRSREGSVFKIPAHPVSPFKKNTVEYISCTKIHFPLTLFIVDAFFKRVKQNVTSSCVAQSCAPRGCSGIPRRWQPRRTTSSRPQT